MGNAIIERSEYITSTSINNSDERFTVVNTDSIYAYCSRIGSTIIWIESLLSTSSN